MKKVKKQNLQNPLKSRHQFDDKCSRGDSDSTKCTGVFEALKLTNVGPAPEMFMRFQPRLVAFFNYKIFYN